MQIKKQLLGACVASSVVGLCGIAWGDPLSGETLKFYQAPLNNAGPIYPQQASAQPQDVSASPAFTGHDVFSTAKIVNPATSPTLYRGLPAADDFGDHVTTPIDHVTFWGSYMGGYDPTNAANGGFVQRFLINFYTENPGSNTAGTASSPMTLYSSQVVTAGALLPQSGTFTESLVPNTTGPSGDTGLYKYNAELRVPAAEPVMDTSAGPAAGPIGTVDWISIVALAAGASDGNPNIQWGWHNRDYGIFDPLAIGGNPTGPGESNINVSNVPAGQPVYHFQDDAVQDSAFTYDDSSGISTGGSYSSLTYIPGGTDLPGGVVPYSEDLAFALYTSPVPEPGALSLIGLGALGLLRKRDRKSRT